MQGGNDLDEVGWYNDNSGGKSKGVGQKRSNGCGLYDMVVMCGSGASMPTIRPSASARGW